MRSGAYLEGNNVSTIDATTWPAKYPQERIVCEFDFTSELPVGDVVEATEFTLTTVLGTDSAPEALLHGAALVKGARIFQKLQGGLADSSYRVTCQISTQSGRILVLSRVLPVISL